MAREGSARGNINLYCKRFAITDVRPSEIRTYLSDTNISFTVTYTEITADSSGIRNEANPLTGIEYYAVDGPNDPLRSGYNLNLQYQFENTTNSYNNPSFIYTYDSRHDPGGSGLLILLGGSGEVNISEDCSNLNAGTYRIKAWFRIESVDGGYFGETNVVYSSTFTVVTEEPPKDNADTIEYSLGGVSANTKIAYGDIYKFTPFFYHIVKSNKVTAEYSLFITEDAGSIELYMGQNVEPNNSYGTSITNLQINDSSQPTIIIKNVNSSSTQKNVRLVITTTKLNEDINYSTFVIYPIIILPKENTQQPEQATFSINSGSTNIPNQGQTICTISTTQRIMTNVTYTVTSGTNSSYFNIAIAKVNEQKFSLLIQNKFNTTASSSVLLSLNFTVTFQDGGTQTIKNCNFYLLPKTDSGCYMIRVTIRGNVPSSSEFGAEDATGTFIINNVKFS